jgi:putative transposase
VCDSERRSPTRPPFTGSALEEENRKLKKLLAETMLDASPLKEMLGKNF